MVLTTQCAEMEREFPSSLLPPLPHCDSAEGGEGSSTSLMVEVEEEEGAGSSRRRGRSGGEDGPGGKREKL